MTLSLHNTEEASNSPEVYTLSRIAVFLDQLLKRTSANLSSPGSLLLDEENVHEEKHINGITEMIDKSRTECFRAVNR